MSYLNLVVYPSMTALEFPLHFISPQNNFIYSFAYQYIATKLIFRMSNTNDFNSSVSIWFK